MRDQAVLVIVIVAAIGSGLIAGVFFAFSTFVMKALARRPWREGIAAMQEINVVVINPVFLGAFLGTAMVSAAALVMAVMRWNGWIMAGGLLYLAGTFGVTIVGNVPLNNRLAAVKAEDAEAEGVWREYVRRWTVWNHVRTAAGVAAMGAFVMATMRMVK